jgi:hypothetical protein
MSGADLANVTNEGALIAARNGQKQINFIVSVISILSSVQCPLLVSTAKNCTDKSTFWGSGKNKSKKTKF